MTHTSGYFHTDDPVTLRWLAAVIATAVENERGVCLNVVQLPGEEPSLMVKVGGSWTAPLEGTPHISRDLSDSQKVTTSVVAGMRDIKFS